MAAGSHFNIGSLVQTIAHAYSYGELRVFLRSYFNINIELIALPHGRALFDTVLEVVEYFDRRHELPNLIAELNADRPGLIDVQALMRSSSAAAASASGPTASSTNVGFATGSSPNDSPAFYFIVKPEQHSLIPGVRGEMHIEIPVFGGTSQASGSVKSFALALDRSGSMAGGKLDVAKSTAWALCELSKQAGNEMALVVFDDRPSLVYSMAPAPSNPTLQGILQSITPQGRTDLFGAWEMSIRQPRLQGGQGQVVLLTDGHLNVGCVDPAYFVRCVRTAWRQRQISTSCISMGDDWNVELLQQIALAGGGKVQFIGNHAQAKQVVREVMSASGRVIACNVCMRVEGLNGASIKCVQGGPVAPAKQHIAQVTNQLLASVRESAVVQVMVPSLAEPTDIFRCRIEFEDPQTATPRVTDWKTLRLFPEQANDTSSQAVPVNRGVVCCGHLASSKWYFRRAVSEFVLRNMAAGLHNLEQSRFALRVAGQRPPSAYRDMIGLHSAKVGHLEEVWRSAAPEELKELFIHDISSRDRLWLALCFLVDRIVEWQNRHSEDESPTGRFHSAYLMMLEYSRDFPVQEFSRSREEGPVEEFWYSEAGIWRHQHAHRDAIQRGGRHTGPTTTVASQRNLEDIGATGTLPFTVAGGCARLEVCHQETRTGLMGIMASYLTERGYTRTDGW